MTSDDSPMRSTVRPSPLLLLAGLAAALPTMLGLALPPSPTMAQQCAAFVLWGALVAAVAPGWPRRGAAWALLASLGVLAGAALLSTLLGAWPASLAVLTLAALVAAGLLVAAGHAAGRGTGAVALFTALAWGLLAAGAYNAAVAIVQVWLPDLADGWWIARTDLPGRAIGNIRHANHLATLLLWSLVAAAALGALRRLPRGLLWAAAALLVLGIELSASRLGAAGLLLLAGWGVVDRRLPNPVRAVLIALPLLYALAWAALAVLPEAQQGSIGAGARLAAEQAGSPNARLNVWRTTWALVSAHPWAGVGFGEFNLAWTLTAFPGRPIAFFDHSHNLLLQFAVELGLPLALLLLALLGWAAWQAWRVAVQAEGDVANVARPILVLLLLIAGHSMVEHPLWFAYFLLPTALLWGLLLGLAPSATPARPARHLLGAVAGGLVLLGGLMAWLDYRSIVDIHMPREPATPPMARLQVGQHSLLFAHLADQAAAVQPTTLASRQLGLARGAHVLASPPLLVAWAQYLAAAGDVERARWLAQRLREFNDPGAQPFFAPCSQPQATAFQCVPPASQHDWREFLVLPPLTNRPTGAPSSPGASR